MKLLVDWNMVNGEGLVGAVGVAVLGDFVVADDGEGTVFLAIVARVVNGCVQLRPTDRVLS